MITCPNCRQDNPEAARFCMYCGTPLPVVCPSCGVELPANARFCMDCGHPVRLRSSDDDVRQARLAAAAPAPLVDKARQAVELAGERRTVTILYADVVDSTALAAELGDERWAALLTQVFDRVVPAVYRYEGTIARILGDSLWAFFGAPVAHEDDPDRAANAALNLLELARGLAAELQAKEGIVLRMRACLHTGPVVVGPVAHDLKYEISARGGAIDIPARLKFAAEPMTVLASEQTYRFIAPTFACEARGPVMVKGQSRSIETFEVLGRKARPAPARGLAGLASAMVGRDAELASLVQLTEAVEAGLGRVAVILGEPGMGKTRLVSEWRTALQQAPSRSLPVQWAFGYGRSYGQGLAYHLLSGLLRSLIGLSDSAHESETDAALTQLLNEKFPAAVGERFHGYLSHLLALPLEPDFKEKLEGLDPQALQTQYREALRAVLGALAADRLLILALEDLHWADPSSVALLADLLPLVNTAPILFCMVSRPEKEAPGWRLVNRARQLVGDSLTEINLRALSEADSRRLISNLLELEALPDNVRKLILSKAEGNPFFVEEVIRMLIERQAIVRQNGGWTAGKSIHKVDIPDNLRGLLLARIDRLPEDVKQTLRVAAVIGRQFPLNVLAQVMEDMLRDITE
jgi:class 3 adenylate cyclase